MNYFEFSTTVIDKVIAELEKAQAFIKIAVFQMHDPRLFELLKAKSGRGVRVELFTLPYDSINASVHDEVTGLFENLREDGVTVHFCKWNIGDPERTTTAIGRWYSYHGKFIVTDKTAMILSANFTRQQELDALLMKDDAPSIKEFSDKFDELVDLFVKDYSGNDGKIRELILDSGIPNAEKLFELPRVIETETHVSHWIQHYPAVISPESVEINNGLYITPFDGRARNILMQLIDKAESYIFISTESFTDEDFSKFLVKTSLRGVHVKVLTGSTSMDFSDRMQEMLRDLLAAGVSVFSTVQNLHAKLLITDKALVVSSVNLNKINLGFPKTRRFWRSNTETIYVSDNQEVVLEAKRQFEQVLEGCYDISINLSEKLLNQVTNLFSYFYGLRTNQEVKALFSRFILKGQIDYKIGIHKIAKLTSLIMQKYNKRTIGKNEFLQALILFYLSERQHDILQLQEKISSIASDLNLTQLLDSLIENNYIEKVNEYYKINIETLLR
ncbi:MAG: phospholipase D family protein [Anaerolineales bacterium]|nr:phospholipase D family protein [Anaerolineales bacterium]